MTKTDFDAKLSSLNRKITKNKSKHIFVENELKKLKTFDVSYFIGKSHFEEDGTQNYLAFQPINRYFKVIANTLYISSWKSKRLSDETIKPPATSDNSLTTLIDYIGNKIKIKFPRSCFKQPKLFMNWVPLAIMIMILHWKSVYLVQLLWLKTQILISMGILVMELDLIEDQVFHFQAVDLVKMY